MNNDKINVKISPVAFMKMQTLVMGFDKEVGWYGTVERIEDGFRIKDVLVFPQYTSAAYIDDERDDPLEFRKWLDTLSDDDYNSRRLWAHSHVNMGVSPSGVDTNMFKRFKDSCCVEGIPNRFTLCLIMNKRSQTYWWAYDADAQKEYKNKDINFMIEVEEGKTNLEFFEWAKGLVRDIYPTTAFLFGSYGATSGGYSGYATGYNYGGYNTHAKEKESAKKTENKTDTKTTTTTTTSKVKSIVDDCDIFDDYGDPWYDGYYSAYGAYGSYDPVDNDGDNATQLTSGSTDKSAGSTGDKSGSTKDEKKDGVLPAANSPIPIDTVVLRDFKVSLADENKDGFTVKVEEFEVAPSLKTIDVYDMQKGLYKNQITYGNSYTFADELFDVVPPYEVECMTVIDYLLFHFFNRAVDSFSVMKCVSETASESMEIDSVEAATEMLNSHVFHVETYNSEDEDGQITHSLFFVVE